MKITQLTLLACLAAPALAQAPMPGSVLVFPSIRNDATTVTFLSVTNTQTTPASQSTLNAPDIMAYFNYVVATEDPNDIFRPLGCTHFCRPEFLTAADTVSVSVSCHSPYPVTHGYLVAHAVSVTNGQNVSHNYLAGSAQIFDFTSGAIYVYPAIPFCSPKDPGENTDMNWNGRIDFDGVEYEKMHRDLIVDSFFAAGNSRIALADFSCLPEGRETTVLFSIWNDNEYALSMQFPFRCWFETELDMISVLFTQQWLQTVPNDPEELDINCDGINDFESGWIRITGIQSQLGTLVDNEPPLLGVMIGGPRSCTDGRVLWGSKERRDGWF